MNLLTAITATPPPHPRPRPPTPINPFPSETNELITPHPLLSLRDLWHGCYESGAADATVGMRRTNKRLLTPRRRCNTDHQDGR